MIISTLDSLQKALVAVFDHNMKAEEAAQRLMNINQGRKSVAEFAILPMLPPRGGWTNP